MAVRKHHVTIKGIKDGLVFVMNDECTFLDLIQELDYKLDKTYNKLLSGPLVHVHVKLGRRQVNESEKELLLAKINRRNLVVQSIDSDVHQPPAPTHKLMAGIIRSGQTLRHDGDLLFVGDVNPGGTIIASGNIYVLGTLRGMAHAGQAGDLQAYIAASYFKPTQVRIAEMISRPPDEWGLEDTAMMFAYIHNDQMEIEKIANLHRIRPEAAEQFKGE